MSNERQRIKYATEHVIEEEKEYGTNEGYKLYPRGQSRIYLDKEISTVFISDMHISISLKNGQQIEMWYK